MRILAVSDLRVQSIRLLETVARQVRPDLILYAGDDVARFGPGENSWSPLAQRTPLGLAGVLGNDCAPEDARAFEQPGCHNLGQKPLLLDGLAILGLEGAPRDEAGTEGLGTTLYSRHTARAHLTRQLQASADRPIILVSHTPPRGVLDTAVRFGINSIGSTVVREFMEHPNVHGVVCGHVHSHGGRIERVGHCTVVNIASLDQHASPLRYAVLDWDGQALRVTVDQWQGEHTLAQMPGVGPSMAEKLGKHGFHSVADVIEGDAPKLAAALGGVGRVRKLRAQARALHEQRPVILAREPQNFEDAILLDIETSLGGNDPWLVGFTSWGVNPAQQFVELNPALHGQHLQNVGEAVIQGRAQRYLQWGTFDRSVLEKAHRLNGLEVPPWLARNRWLDAGSWLKRVVALPVTGYGLKPVAHYFDYPFQSEGLDGFQVGMLYSMYRANGNPFDVEAIKKYNQDDVLAVEHVLRCVLEILQDDSALVEPALKLK